MTNRCKADLGSWSVPRPCRRNATRDGWCFQHHPDAVVQRAVDASRAAQERTEEERRRIVRRGLFEATMDELRAEIARRES